MLPLFQALAEVDIPVVVTRHEQGAAFMADAYARLHGIGCVVTTSGPGGLNALSGVAASYMDSVPMVVLTAQADVAEFGRYGIQEGTGLGRTPNVPQIFDATTKRSLQPRTTRQLRAHIDAALSLAVDGRPGPVHVDIPSDLLTAAVDDGPDDGPPTAVAASEPLGVAAEDIAAIARRIRAAERPLLLAGNGVIRSGGVAAAQRLVRQEGMWLVHSFLAKGAFDERDPLVLGSAGIYGTRAANHALHHEADLVLAVGVAFSYLTTSGWTARLDGDRLIRCDLDKRELDTNYQAGVRVHADARVFLDAVVAELARTGAGRRAVVDLKAAYPDRSPAAQPGGPLHPIRVCEVLNEVLDDGTTVVADVGQNAYWVERYLRSHGGGSFLINGGLGAMGHAVAGALGASQARTDAGRSGRVLCTCGDGGFMMGALEVSIAVAKGADITWVIFNNGTLGTQKAWYEREGYDGAAMDLPPIDYASLAISMGARGRTVRTEDELRAALTDRDAAGPRVIDVWIDPQPAPEGYQP